MRYRYDDHIVYQIEQHLVWVTKYRYKVLRGEVAERVRALVRQTCEALEIRIVHGVVSKDHVHILVSAPPNLAPSEIMRRIKRRTSSYLFEEFSHIKKRGIGGVTFGHGSISVPRAVQCFSTSSFYDLFRSWDGTDAIVDLSRRDSRSPPSPRSAVWLGALVVVQRLTETDLAQPPPDRYHTHEIGRHNRIEQRLTRTWSRPPDIGTEDGHTRFCTLVEVQRHTDGFDTRQKDGVLRQEAADDLSTVTLSAADAAHAARALGH